MSNSYNLDSILDAIENLNNKSTKEAILPISVNEEKIKKKILFNEDILPITEKLILEAEEYSNKLVNKSPLSLPLSEDVLVLDNEYIEQDLKIANLNEIKLNIIDDLYSSLSKKFKKNTLKTIFDLRQKINNLENEIKFLSEKKANINIYSDEVNNFNDNAEHLINEEHVEQNEKYLIEDEKNDISVDVINTLKLQESLIKNFEINEEKLRSQIADLQQDIILLNNIKINNQKIVTEDSTQIVKNNFDGQTKLLDRHNTKSKNELIFYKDNYERLIIENHDIKNKSLNIKRQITIYEQNINELENAFENLNNILSKNSIIKLNESPKKISTEPESSILRPQKLVLPSQQIFDKDDK